MKKILYLFCFICILSAMITGGCDEGTKHDTPEPTPTPSGGYEDMGGTWNFVDHLSSGDDESPGTIVQTGNNLSVTYDNYPSFGPLVGTLNGSSFVVAGPSSSGESTWSYSGTVNDSFTEATGSISVTDVATGEVSSSGTFTWSR